MELDDIDALRASVAMLRGTNDRMIDEIGVRTGVRLDDRPSPAERPARRSAAPSPGPRHIDEVLADDGEVAGTGFVIPGDLPPAPPPSSTY
jgi:hypothetical protein